MRRSEGSRNSLTCRERYRLALIESVLADIGKARNVLWAELNAAVQPLGITGRQMDILLLLDRGAASCAADLSRLLVLNPGMLSHVIDGLEATKMVSRARTGEDRRVARLQLTQLGRQTAIEGPESVRGALNVRFDNFTMAELQQMRGLLQKLLRNRNCGVRAERQGGSNAIAE